MSRKRKARLQDKEIRPAYQWLVPTAVLVVLGAVAYWNSTDAPFVFDDLEIFANRGVIRARQGKSDDAQRWLGHACASTTAIYADACGPEEIAFAAEGAGPESQNRDHES